ncbi:hypothetical protein QBC46DRAFT_373830 [Diplogelasinospora grovesii]|uniref:Thioredoxin domain-containing protein n=1 Tax=Diplogelasinospora grovesii TaxID=303347 RepID=A0AAN6NGA7_9PEZI|nr:hypothetical protein QBC46DRAFT_373830 [Diplogelasinospora grovesii]
MSLATIRSTLSQELQSFKTPPPKEVAPLPKVGDPAPTSFPPPTSAPSAPALSFPSDKPVLVVFLRHCGCPFAEKTFKSLTKLSTRHPELHCIAVSHSSQTATDRWIIEVGGEWDVQVIVDPDRDLYSAWGLGISSTWHALSPWAIYKTYQLGKTEGIWNRTTESGSRWQTGGAFAVDKSGIVRWVQVAHSADDIPNFDDAITALGLEVDKRRPSATHSHHSHAGAQAH